MSKAKFMQFKQKLSFSNEYDMYQITNPCFLSLGIHVLNFFIIQKKNVRYTFKQFHWPFLTTHSGFWLINILLRKFDNSSGKEMKMIKKKIFDEKQKNAKKVHANIM